MIEIISTAIKNTHTTQKENSVHPVHISIRMGKVRIHDIVNNVLQ